VVYVPAPGVTPFPPPPVLTLTPEIAIQRQLTAWYIAQDPTAVVLIPHAQVKLPSGGFEAADLPPRPQQTFKLIAMSYTERPVQATGTGNSGSGVQRKYDFTLMGNWDATVEATDWWEDPVTEQRWVIDAVSPWNGYEVKALVMSYGGKADHGGT
jgi:hypothetical protein